MSFIFLSQIALLANVRNAETMKSVEAAFHARVLYDHLMVRITKSCRYFWSNVENNFTHNFTAALLTIATQQR